ncbi:transporter [Clostridium sp. chh4-2]|uniref:AEC family transporter n=1 Tax=Clostridium sp. chh4-2 TaxID=2067550 RepID=UPI000CCEAB81|nr:AEC family transporter [Clostridium sp. chh4-2]PNV64040.1 transporter [Clostridium sp. chh4-2]
MAAILPVFSRAFAFVMIIAVGYVLKRRGFFHAKDFFLISKIVINITLPSAIISNFSKITMEKSLLMMCVIGLVSNILLVLLGFMINLGRSKEDKMFDMINLSGYNIGNFTVPFVQSFLGPVGFAATSLFDAGNAVMCTGITYSLASAVMGTGEKVSIKAVLRKLFSSVPFDSYVVMTTLTIMNVKLPSLLIDFTGTVGGANAFLALLMLGIGFEVNLDKGKAARIMKLLVLRYGTAVLFSLAFYFLMPFELEVRQALAILSFGPVSSVSPAFTGNLGGDVELASAVNSLSILVSIISITIALIIIL